MKGVLSRWRKESQRKKDCLRKAKNKARKIRLQKKDTMKYKSVSFSDMLNTLSKQKKSDAMKKYIIHKAPGAHLSFIQREFLAADWNRRIKYGQMPTLRSFAKAHGLATSTWAREFNRGKTGITIPDSKHPGRWIYSEYDPSKAQDDVNTAAANKGPKMKVTNLMAKKFTQLVKEEKRSPYDAVQIMRKENSKVPCVRTWYNHIAHGDIPVKYGETPYHPSKKKRYGQKPHPAKTMPGRLQMKDRPKEANERSEIGHLEIDTIVSCIGGRGGLLVLIDRCTREYFIEKIKSVSQESVIVALKKMKHRGIFKNIKSATPDNGGEFIDPNKLKATIGCDIYYTRAYASWEKGSIENCNRIVRRWYPKGTDFSLLTRAEVHKLENTINSIHRLSLGGMSAHDYAERKRMSEGMGMRECATREPAI